MTIPFAIHDYLHPLRQGDVFHFLTLPDALLAAPVAEQMMEGTADGVKMSPLKLGCDEVTDILTYRLYQSDLAKKDIVYLQLLASIAQDDSRFFQGVLGYNYMILSQAFVFALCIKEHHLQFEKTQPDMRFELTAMAEKQVSIKDACDAHAKEFMSQVDDETHYENKVRKLAKKLTDKIKACDALKAEVSEYCDEIDLIENKTEEMENRLYLIRTLEELLEPLTMITQAHVKELHVHIEVIKHHLTGNDEALIRERALLNVLYDKTVLKTLCLPIEKASEMLSTPKKTLWFRFFGHSEKKIETVAPVSIAINIPGFSETKL